MTEPVRIVAAAIERDGLIFSLPPPARHGTVMVAMEIHSIEIWPGPEEQGFLTSEGQFVGRVAGLAIAKASGQYGATRKPSGLDELFSEDLW